MGVVRIPVIVGPTAVGKSAVALDLARQAGAAIISADSRQVYRGFDIGTAKPTHQERAQVSHFMLDVAEPNERYSAARWANGATEVLGTLRARAQLALIVGGTGFYLRALTAPLFQEPPLDVSERALVFEALNGLSTHELRAQVQELDPPRAHLGRAQLLRALEVVRLTGTPISEWYARSHQVESNLAVDMVVLDRSQSLHDRITARVQAMFAQGWIEEVGRLSSSIPPDAPAWNATGYSLIRQVVEGTLELPKAQERIVIATRQYAKRQRTWFRHQPEGRVTRIDLDQPGAEERLRAWWRDASLGAV